MTESPRIAPVWLSVGYAVSPAGRHQTKHLCVCVCGWVGGCVRARQMQNAPPQRVDSISQSGHVVATRHCPAVIACGSLWVQVLPSGRFPPLHLNTWWSFVDVKPKDKMCACVCVGGGRGRTGSSAFLRTAARLLVSLTPATAGVGRCHNNFLADVSRCQVVLVEAHRNSHTHRSCRCRQVSLKVLASVGRCHEQFWQVSAGVIKRCGRC